MRVLLLHYYNRSTKHPGWGRTHPVDVQYGIRTSGYIPSYLLNESPRKSQVWGCYAGSQPSVIRRVLALLPDHEETSFLDLGCGKGRVLAVASEFPFREVIGVELSDTVAAMAEANMNVLRRRYPQRCEIRVVTGDAIKYPLPDSPLVIFLYNPFDEAVFKPLLQRIEETLEKRDQRISIVYYHPLCGALLDASPWFKRVHALSLRCSEEEEGFAPDIIDTVVMWQDVRHAREPSKEAQRQIVVTSAGKQVTLAPLGAAETANDA